MGSIHRYTIQELLSMGSFISPVIVVPIKMWINRDCSVEDSTCITFEKLTLPSPPTFQRERKEVGRKEGSERKREHTSCKRLILSRKRLESQESMNFQSICLDPSQWSIFYIIIQQTHKTKMFHKSIFILPCTIFAILIYPM